MICVHVDELDIEQLEKELIWVSDELARYAIYGNTTDMDREEERYHEREVAELQDYLEALNSRGREIFEES